MGRISSVLAVVAGVSCGAVSLEAQVPPRPFPGGAPAPTATVRGRVVAADTGLPITDASVRILPTGRLGTIVFPMSGVGGVAVDESGSFTVADAPTGDVLIAVSPGASTAQYLSVQFPDSARDGQTSFTLTAGQVLDDVVVALPRGGAITGRVVNDRGLPLAMMSVAIVERLPGGRFRELSSSAASGGNRVTDDLGQFRLFGLRPAEYLVAVQPSLVSRTGNATPSYYPSTTQMAEAVSVRVRTGEEVGPIEVQIARARMAKIRGLVQDSGGQPALAAQVALTPWQPVAADSRSAAAVAMRRPPTVVMSRDGSFEFTQLPPNDYVLTAFSADIRREWARLSVKVADDVDGLVVRMKPGATVTGNVAFEGQSVEGTSWLQIKPVPEIAADRAPSVQVKDDGSFVLEDLIGPTVIQIAGAKNWYVKSVQQSGRDITDEAVDFTESPAPLTVTLTQRAGTLRGAVTMTDGRPARATVIVLSELASLRHERAGTTRSAETRRDGGFSIEGLRGGRYVALAIPLDTEPFIGATAEYFELIAKHGTRFSVSENETRQLDLRLTTLR